MAVPHEIISLQFGHFSNYVGAHFWNIQESGFSYSNDASEICHDVLFREGKTAKNEVTYTPRLLLCDLKGALGTLPERGDLYDPFSLPDKDGAQWSGDMTIERQPPHPKNEYLKDLETVASNVGKRGETKSYNLENSIATWSDYLYSRFHPRTVNIIKDFQHGNTEVPFNIFNSGKTLWSTAQFQDEYCDRLRNYVEECDYLQGFQITVDSTDGFGGLASGCMQYIQDEYNRSVLTIPLIAPDLPTDPLATSYRLVNLTLCYQYFADHSSLFAPMSTEYATSWRLNDAPRTLPNIDYKRDSLYHSAAILASAMDTMTLPYRMKLNQGEYSIVGLCSDLSRYGRKMAATSLGLPFGINKKVDLIDYLDHVNTPLFTSLTPNCEIGTDKVMQIISLQGLSEDRLKKPQRTAGKQLQMAAYGCTTVKEMMTLHFSCSGYATASNVSSVASKMSVPLSYPQFFKSGVDTDGWVDDILREDNQDVRSVPVLAGLHNTPNLSDSLDGLIREAKRVKIAKIHGFKEAGLEVDEYPETLEMLMNLKDCYEESFEL